MGFVSNGTILRKSGEVLPESALEELSGGLGCRVVLRGRAAQDEYEVAIDRWNQAGIKEAAIVVYCESEDDVSACLRWVGKWGLDLAIAGGRHTFHNASSTDGLVIDLRKMQTVTVDKAAMTVIAQGGCLAEQVEVAAEAEGLSVVFGNVNDTGIAGLTLGGGSGWLTGQYGHAIDNLLSVRMVIADGTVVTASEKENSDLFWGIRGGGSNFGVVTEFTYRAHKQGPVYFGVLIYSPDKMRACFELMNTLYTTAIEPSGGKFQLYLGVLKPPGVEVVCPMYLIYYNGPEEEGRAYAAPLVALGPMHGEPGIINYAASTGIHKLMDAGNVHHRYTNSTVQLELPLDVDILMALAEDFSTFLAKYPERAGPSKLAIELRSFAVTGAVPVSAMAYASRHKLVNVVIEAQYDKQELDGEMREEMKKIIMNARNSTAEKRRLQGKGEVLVNANYSSGVEKVNAVFGENLPRLRELKRKYDPGFVFNKWYPIPLAEV